MGDMFRILFRWPFPSIYYADTPAGVRGLYVWMGLLRIMSRALYLGWLKKFSELFIFGTLESVMLSRCCLPVILGISRSKTLSSPQYTDRTNMSEDCLPYYYLESKDHNLGEASVFSEGKLWRITTRHHYHHHHDRIIKYPLLPCSFPAPDLHPACGSSFLMVRTTLCGR